MPWHIYLAIKQLFPTGRFISFYALIGILGVATGVSVLYISMCIMNGFQSEIYEKVKDTNGDIQISGGDTIEDWEAVIAQIEEHPNVIVANPYIMGIVMAAHDNRPAFPGVWAIDPSQEKQVLPYEEKGYILQGSLDDLDDESVIISIGIARNLGLTVGEIIEIYTPMMIDRRKKDEIILPTDLTVVGIYETGWEDADDNVILFHYDSCRISTDLRRMCMASM